MADGLSRADLQSLANIRLSDANLLLENKRFSSAYYLAGYAVEFGLKACIAKQISAESIPSKRFIQDIHTHDLEKLATAAGLKAELKAKQDGDAEFQANWGLAGDWNPECRYTAIDAMSAQLLMLAIGHPKHGIMQWIRTVW